MFWKKNDSNIKDLENRLMDSEAELSFIHSQLDPVLANAVYQQSDINLDDKKCFNTYQATLLKIEFGSLWPIQQEIDCLGRYLQLYKKFVNSEIVYKSDFNISDIDLNIPSLLLFPIVRNALQNGYHSKENYPVNIKLKIGGNNLHFEVSNRVNHYLGNQGENKIIQRLESRLNQLYVSDYNLFINSNSNLFKISLILHLKK